MIMEAALRSQKLADIKKGMPFMTGIRIRPKGDNLLCNAYQIPLEYLVYNKYNARIGSLVKTFEIQNRTLNSEAPKDIEIIEQFLWDSKPDRNKRTMESLAQDGQKVFGIVTCEGIIIDGNRRAMLLNRVYKEREKWQKIYPYIDHCRYFVAVILDENVETKEIVKLETSYQMGEDEKLGYNPIEKYLRCKDLKELYDYTEADIAKMMVEDKSTIIEWLEIMKLMDEYLEYLGYNGIYTRLEKREGQFLNLNQYLKRYNNTNKSTSVEWPYDGLDIEDLKFTCFDYIRAQYEGKDFRLLAQPSKNSFFCKEKVWKKFLDDHKKARESVQESSVEELRKENPNYDLTKLLEARDNDWKRNVENIFKQNYYQANHLLDDINDADKPADLAKRAYETLNSINTEIETFYSSEVDEWLKGLNSLAYVFRKLIKKHNRL
jgi:hypothetical protein